MSVEMSQQQQSAFGHEPMVARHNLHEHELFSDEALVELLDTTPREHLFALTMGTDPERSEDNALALHNGVSGKDLLQAVKAGRLWLNCTMVYGAVKAYRDLVDALYADVAAQCPGFQPTALQATILISSPNALVYYHVDGPPSLLWHVRGKKRIWVYPALDTRLVSQEDLEDIHAGVLHEYVPYSTAFDAHAVVYDLEPGDWASWPQNSPHRITNHDCLNVSLSTEHYTPEARRRTRLYCANRFLRQRLHLPVQSTRESGLRSWAKRNVYGVCSKLGLDRRSYKQHVATLRVDPNAPQGCVPL